MKSLKQIILSSAFLFLSLTAYAVPAINTPVVVRQSDGTTITVMMHGDEFFHYSTTLDDYTLAYDDAAGYYCYAVTASDGSLKSSGVKASDPSSRSAEETAALRSIPTGLINNAALARSSFARMDAGESRAQALEARRLTRADASAEPRAAEEIKGLVILVNFKNVSFKHTSAEFDALMNQTGYNAGGAFGSVHDYFYENSNGRFSVNFDVAGPYTLSQNRSYYGANGNGAADDLRPREMVKEAYDAAAADGSINLSDYATNGVINNLMVIYAGNGENDTGISEAIWPHEWWLETPYTKNGVTIRTYACSSELKGTGEITGIGTICHEYCHVLGLRDFYDNDSQGGTAFGLDVFSLMDRGNYVQNGMRPPALSAYERFMSGWLEPVEITEPGTYTLEPVYDADKAYMIKTSSEGEVFFFENRNGTSFKWDNFLNGGDRHTRTNGTGAGLYVTHIDRSKNSYGGVVSSQRWTDNTINHFAAHQCMQLFMAQTIMRPSGGSLDDIGKVFYPGDGNVTSLTATSEPKFRDWKGVTPGVHLENISMNGNDVILTVGGEGVKPAGLPSLDLAPSYNAGQTIKLALKNISQSSIRSTVWKVGGAASVSTSITLSAGEYLIEAEVTKTDGSKEYFLRYIDVK